MMQCRRGGEQHLSVQFSLCYVNNLGLSLKVYHKYLVDLMLSEHGHYDVLFTASHHDKLSEQERGFERAEPSSNSS